jgi:hypothetical protein
VTWLIWYLAIGLVVLLVIVLADQLSMETRRSLRRELMDAIDGDRKLWFWKLAVNLFALVPLVLSVLFVIFSWPIMFFWKGHDMWTQHAQNKREVFVIARKDLVRQWTVQEVEMSTRVIDPLGAVPDLPFGHLNGAWLQFKQVLQPQDVLWSFSSNWTVAWEPKKTREGYVVSRGKRIGPHIVTSWHEPPSEGDT